MSAVSPLEVVRESEEHEVKLAAAYATREDRIKTILRTHAIHGARRIIARRAGMSPDVLSRYLSGESSHVPEAVVEVSLDFFCGTPEGGQLASAVQMLREGRIQSFTVETKEAQVIRFPGGGERIAFE